MKSTKSLCEQDYKERNLSGQQSQKKLKTFKTQAKMVKKKVDGRIIQLREVRSLLSRFLITSRKRSELDLEHCLGNFEFIVVLRSLFTSDGEPLACKDKWKVLYNIEELVAAQVRE